MTARKGDPVRDVSLYLPLSQEEYRTLHRLADAAGTTTALFLVDFIRSADLAARFAERAEPKR